MGAKQTLITAAAMSAFERKADMETRTADVRL
jgi:hypothetical protein